METQYFCDYSPSLGRMMECKVYGHAGRPVLFVPCQDGRFFDFEGYHMTETWGHWIESGEVMILAIDTIDKETWSDKVTDPRVRAELHEAWMRYITNEAAPKLQHLAQERNGWDYLPGVIAFGCSLGATHAANLFLRFPDQFTGLLALSGIYNAAYGFGDYMDELVYQNSPVHYMENLTYGHPYIEKYNRNNGIICVGTGAWEIPDTTIRLKQICEEKNIGIWVDVWGTDVDHDWPWWHRQVAYFVPKLLGY